MLKTWLHRLRVDSHRRQAVARLRELEYRLPSARVRFAAPFVFQGKGFFRSIRPRQSPREIEQAYQAILEHRPRRVLEIGTAKGGTLYLWAQAAADDALIVSVDLPGGMFGGGYDACRLPFYEAFARPGQTIKLFRADSQSPQTLALVRQALGEQPVDFAFIDADHRYAGVKRDFLLYGPLVRPGGLIGFHDICPARHDPQIQVARLWDQLKARFETRQFVEPDDQGRLIGIGLLRVPAGGIGADLGLE